MSLVRLQKYIADCGVTSRRKAEDLISQGRVLVNGDKIQEMGVKVNPSTDVVTVDGNTIDTAQIQKVYILLNKPRGCVTTVSDPEGRNTVMDLIKGVSERIYPVGRLDYLSEGLLILTNDGDMAQQITHPSNGIIKVYEVKVFGSVTPEILKKLRAGARVSGSFVRPKSVRVIKQLPSKTWLEFRVGEGRNREIRKLCEEVGLTVDKLKRISIGGISVENIAPGKYLYLSKRELQSGLRGADARSSKKTIKLSKSGYQQCTPADDSKFHPLRRSTYFKTLSDLNKKKGK